jgi:valyl-tRNA synthetase
VVATTRPETLLGDVAVAVNPEDERYAHLVGKQVHLPLTGRSIPVIADAYVDKEFGTGCVKITPAHDFNDWQVGHRHGLAPISSSPWTRASTSTARRNTAAWTATRRARPIVADLEAQGLLVSTKPHKLMVPRGDRTGVVIEPMLTDQWFVAMSKPGADGKSIAGKALECVASGEIRFVPGELGQHLQPVAQQHPGLVHLAPALVGPPDPGLVLGRRPHLRRARRGRGLCAGKRRRLHGGLERDPDVLDTWYSSALWPFSTLGPPSGRQDRTRR